MNAPFQIEPTTDLGLLQRPESVSDTGIRREVLEDLALKILYLSGPFSLLDLSKYLRLSMGISEELFQRLRAAQLCQVTGMTGNVAEIAISSQGRARALELLSFSQYSGAAPVPLESYTAQVRRQSVRNVEVHPPDVARAFTHLVLDESMLSQIGTALNSGAPIFLYGPTGTGKTSIAGTLSRVVAEDQVWVPFAVEIDGQIIVVYDPLVHKRIAESAPSGIDGRWVLCHRPTVVAGGELTIEMLDLQFNPVTKFYSAPLQMKANNGVLFIDDFGRQRMPPAAFLNRWVVPLDRGIDFLSLAGGKTIEVPFEMLVVFATNMDPSALMDPAFLRRLQTKIKVGSITGSHFCEIFRRVAEDRGLECDPDVINELAGIITGEMGQTLSACYPQDLVSQICSAARYSGEQPRLDRASVKRAAELYFLPSSTR